MKGNNEKGNISIIKSVGIKNGRMHYLIKCKLCRKTKVISNHHLYNQKSCGCLAYTTYKNNFEKGNILKKKKMIASVIGKTFNFLRIIKFEYRHKRNNYFLCKCLLCGNYPIVEIRKFKYGNTKSCGCYNQKMRIENNITHGMSKTRFYKIWCFMKIRCLNEKSISYKNYGGRGIHICKEWSIFENFKKDMHKTYLNASKKYGELNISLDRKDNNDGYYKGNCKWSTAKQQADNRRAKR